MWKGTLYYPTIPDYVAIAFEAARVAAPHVKLFCNDYGWGVGSKFDVIYHMLMNFSSRSPPVPIDGAICFHLFVTFSGLFHDVCASS